jgi:CDP-diacylglycerol--glycerol-3-phosphate 3-phosphatidyltransferase
MSTERPGARPRRSARGRLARGTLAEARRRRRARLDGARSRPGAGARPAVGRATLPRGPRERRERRALRRERRHRRGQRRELVRERLIESRLTPNAISLTGLALNILAALLVWEKLFFLGGIAFVIGSVMDTLDGRYSRMSGKGSPFGAFLDSTLDRVEEGIVLAAVAARFAAEGASGAAAAVVIAVLASLMVSYTRARAEALGVECKVGIAPRAVRVVVLAVGLIFARGASLGGFSLLKPAVYVLAGLSVITVLQRIWHVRRALLADETQAPGA